MALKNKATILLRNNNDRHRVLYIYENNAQSVFKTKNSDFWKIDFCSSVLQNSNFILLFT